MSNERSILVDETTIEVLNITFKNSNKTVKIYLKDGTDKANQTGLAEDCPDITIKTRCKNIYLNTPNLGDLL